jgi:uncharacterized protein YndB with AHSA1/START domain
VFVSVERVVRRRPEVVWACLVDLDALAKWVEGLIGIDRFGGEGVGLRFEVTMQLGKQQVPVTCEVTAWREPRLLAIEGRERRTLLFHRAVLEPHDDGTLVRFEVEQHEPGIIAELMARRTDLLGELIEPPVTKVYERCIESFRKYVEAQTAAAYR